MEKFDFTDWFTEYNKNELIAWLENKKSKNRMLSNKIFLSTKAEF